ncbi:MAG: HD-GYP domain-containing protein [Thermoleophilaceae bacterium]
MEGGGAIRPAGPAAYAVMSGAFLAAVALAVATASSADWDLPLLGSILAFAVISDLLAIDTAANPSPAHRMLMSGGFLPLVLAMVLLGGPPAALIAVGVIAIGHVHFRERRDLFLNNLVAFAWFPLIGGLAFAAARDGLAVDSGDAVYYALVVGVFALALAVNFLAIAGYNCYLDGDSLRAKARLAVLPVLQWDFASALLAATVVYSYIHLGVAALVLFGAVVLTIQRLLGQVFAAEQRARQLEERMEAFAKLHVGLLNTIIRSLDLRDRMTARHSAAVAHYAREIAAAIAMTEAEQDVVHTAALLHDIGKFNLPDPILKADVPLDDDDWQLIRAHPEEGARLVSHLEGYDDAAQLILAHHERFDGEGYPYGLRGTEIPLGGRIISVADTYDVMTSRDSYRKPVSSAEAIAELMRVSGTQLDPAVVSVFVQLLGSKEVRYRHGEDADFDAELGLELPAPASV